MYERCHLSRRQKREILFSISSVSRTSIKIQFSYHSLPFYEISEQFSIVKILSVDGVRGCLRENLSSASTSRMGGGCGSGGELWNECGGLGDEG